MTFQFIKGNCIMYFGQAKKNFLEETIISFANDNDPYGWAVNGLRLILRIIKGYCNFTENFFYFFVNFLLRFDSTSRFNQSNINQRWDLTMFK